MRGNYTNIEKNIYETTKYLEYFLNNLIFGSNKELKNRYLHINQNIKADIEDKKVDIENKKVDIENKKVDIESIGLSLPMKKNIVDLFNSLTKLEFFGRSEVISVLNMSPSGASKFIFKLLDLQIIKPISGHGKGKYIFNIDEVNYV